MRRLHPKIRARVLEKLENLCANWDEHPKKALKGIHRGEFSTLSENEALSTGKLLSNMHRSGPNCSIQ